MADAVARKRHVPVALVLAVGQIVLADICVDLRPRHPEKRPQEALLFRKGVEALQRRTAGEAEEHGLRVVVAMVGGEHGVRTLFQNFRIALAAEGSPLLFKAPAALCGARGNVRPKGHKGHPPRGAEVLYEGSVRGGVLANAVVAGERRKGDVRLFRMDMKIVQKRDGISAARDGDTELEAPIGAEGKELHMRTV